MLKTKNYTILKLAVTLFVLNIFSAEAQSDNSYSTETLKLINKVERNLKGTIVTESQVPWTLEDRMNYYHVPGLSIAVIKDFKIAWLKGYGWADKSLKVPVTTQTLFQAGSVSKSINAVGVLKLVQDKKADLYTDINNYLTSWKFPYDSISKNKKITLANLLSHTAGLTVDGFSGYVKGQRIPSLVQVMDGVKPANSPPIRSAFEPGLRSEYSGGGTMISQLIITDITRQSYEKFMLDSILKPLGMLRSTFVQPLSTDKPELFATGYLDGKPVKGRFHIYAEQAAGGLWSNPGDLARYVIETQLAYEGRSNKVLNAQSAKTMLTPYLDKQAALGVFINDLNGYKYFEHSGLTYGFQTEYYGSLENGNGMVIMINSADDRIISELVNSVASVYGFKGLDRSRIIKTIDVDDAILRSYTGQYSLTPDLSLTISIKDKLLFVKVKGQPILSIHPETQTKFYLEGVDAQLEFLLNEKAQPTGVILFQDGERVEGKKIK